MAINFPNSPSLNDTFVISNTTYTWNGTAWVANIDNISITGTPANNQLAIWTNDTTVEGSSDLTWDGATLTVTGDISVSGTADGRDIANDGTKLDGIASGAQVNTVDKVGTPADNQIGVWTGDGTIEGASNLTWDGSVLTVGNTGAVQLPVGTTAQQPTPAAGMLRYNSDESRFEGYTTSWEAIIPAGAVMAYAMSTAPNGWLECDGSAVSRTTYAALFSAIGTTYGNGDGSTTFNLPDLRGEFIRGWDNGRGADSGRSFGSSQGDAIRNITGTVRTGHSLNLYGSTGISGVFAPAGATGPSVGGSSSSGFREGFNIDLSRQVPTANENRPRNVALMYCIKY